MSTKYAIAILQRMLNDKELALNENEILALQFAVEVLKVREEAFVDSRLN